MLRNSINGTWLFGIIITFMAVFIAFITVSINYSKAYEMKTKMVTIIEQYDGVNPITVRHLNGVAAAYSYRKTGVCKNRTDGKLVGILDEVASVNPNEPQQICITREYKPSDGHSDDKYYYNLEVFFGFNLPVLGNIFTFRVGGETNAIYIPDETDYFN